MNNSIEKPFLKWVGGKSQIIDTVLQKIPREIAIHEHRQKFDIHIFLQHLFQGGHPLPRWMNNISRAVKFHRGGKAGPASNSVFPHGPLWMTSVALSAATSLHPP